MKTFGLILIGLGIIGLLYGGITYNKKEKVLDIGELEASVTKKERVSFPPLAGGAAIVVGALLILVDRKPR
ncbi:MAG TPA: hypothetical protein VF720_12635 [Candidatus Eisenbacteria bacterium]